MPHISSILRSLRSQPQYALMRAVARFAPVRAAVRRSRGVLHARRMKEYMGACERRLSTSSFGSVDRTAFVRQLHDRGVARGLVLPEPMVAEIKRFALHHTCYADRDPASGFRLGNRAAAQSVLGKPILVAQYFNVARECPAVARLIDDPLLQWVAGSYLGSMPSFVGANLWWTFPVQAIAADRDRHAHLFHRDVDDFRFFKFFFYLTDVQPGDGAHVCVAASHRRPPIARFGDRWRIRRYSDTEITERFASDDIAEICGPAGTGFAEDTLCIHKGLTPSREPRLLLQLQYALVDHGVMHDERPPMQLRSIA